MSDRVTWSTLSCKLRLPVAATREMAFHIEDKNKQKTCGIIEERPYVYVKIEADVIIDPNVQQKKYIYKRFFFSFLCLLIFRQSHVTAV